MARRSEIDERHGQRLAVEGGAFGRGPDTCRRLLLDDLRVFEVGACRFNGFLPCLGELASGLFFWSSSPRGLLPGSHRLLICHGLLGLLINVDRLAFFESPAVVSLWADQPGVAHVVPRCDVIVGGAVLLLVSPAGVRVHVG